MDIGNVGISFNDGDIRVETTFEDGPTRDLYNSVRIQRSESNPNHLILSYGANKPDNGRTRFETPFIGGERALGVTPHDNVTTTSTKQAYLGWTDLQFNVNTTRAIILSQLLSKDDTLILIVDIGNQLNIARATPSPVPTVLSNVVEVNFRSKSGIEIHGKHPARAVADIVKIADLHNIPLIEDGEDEIAISAA